MVSKGLLIRMQARPGREADAARFLDDVVRIVEGEPGTTVLFAFRLGPTTFGIFNAFADEAGRQAHIAGDAAAELSRIAAELLSEPPTIEPVDVEGAKLPLASTVAA